MASKITIFACALGLSFGAVAADGDRAGTFKVVRGDVSIDRDGQILIPQVGDAVAVGDRVITAALSFAGITLLDSTRMTAGPDSVLEIKDFAFDTTSHEGRLDTSVRKGTLSVVSGKLAKANPDSVRFNAGSMTLGVRGTEFIIEASGEDAQ